MSELDALVRISISHLPKAFRTHTTFNAKSEMVRYMVAIYLIGQIQAR